MTEQLRAERAKIWTDPDQCGGCAYCSIEPDDLDPTCLHPKVRARHFFGLHITHAIREFCGDDLKLWTKHEGWKK